MTTPITSPWMSISDAAAYTHRGKRFLRNQVKKGALRAAVVGGKRELLFRSQWLDEFLENLATPIVLNMRRRA